MSKEMTNAQKKYTLFKKRDALKAERLLMIPTGLVAAASTGLYILGKLNKLGKYASWALPGSAVAVIAGATALLGIKYWKDKSDLRSMLYQYDDRSVEDVAKEMLEKGI